MNNEDAISRAGLLEAIGQHPETDGNQRAAQILECILAAPSVPPQVVHGHWDECDDDINAWIRCSACGFEQDLDEYGEHSHEVEDYKSCPSCGAIMDGGEDDAETD